MKTLTVKVIENPDWLACRCKLQDEVSDITLCPFFGSECPLGLVSCGLVSCGAVTPGMWDEVLKEEIGEDAES